MKSNYLYLFLDTISILFPLAFSFYPKSNFSKKWKHLFPAIILTAVLFVLWDIAFTQKGVWSFNPKYISGLYFLNLPLEEILFFICIPYACIFLYEAINYLVQKDLLGSLAPSISIGLCSFLVVVGLFNIQRWYTSVTFIVTAIFIATVQWKWKAPFLGRFYFSYAFTLIPFFMINGILTGSFIEEPVVCYNPSEMLGIRIGTVPLEDVFYGMLLLLINVSLFESLKKRRDLV